METDAGVNKYTLHSRDRRYVTSMKRIQPAVEFLPSFFPAVIPEQARIPQNPLNIGLDFQALATPIYQVLRDNRTLGDDVVISNNLNDAGCSPVVLNLDENFPAQGSGPLSFVIFPQSPGYNSRF